MSRVIVLLVICVTAGAGHILKIKEYDPMHPTAQFWQSPDLKATSTREKRAMLQLKFEAAEHEQKPAYWRNVAQNILQDQLKKNELNKNRAKNIIFFMGDGMSVPTLAATRIYMGGEELQLSFEKFPFVGLSKTYCANTQVADSACSATAYLCGVKGNYGTIGMSAAAQLGNCLDEHNTDNHVDSIAKWAQDANMTTGIVTTTKITNASPAGVYAHTVHRNWENNHQLTTDGGNGQFCTDIARQLIYGPVGRQLKVVMGGGREEFLPLNEADEEGKPGLRTDNLNLIKQWQQARRQDKAVYVQNKMQLQEVENDTDYILGLFDAGHMPFHMSANNKTKPTLDEMVAKALDLLEHNNENGYFLFVEGGRIDHGHHNSMPVRAFDETVEFSKAVDMARKRTSDKDTIILVTSDHSHTMSLSGYSSRHTDVLGINNGQLGDDQLVYATLNYANGPGYAQNLMADGKRKDMKMTNMQDKYYQYPSIVPLESGTHGGDDVAIFASGPWAHLFTGVLEQNYIPHALAYASCIGDGLTSCSAPT